MRTGCEDFPNGVVGILGTPTLDRARHAVYVAAGAMHSGPFQGGQLIVGDDQGHPLAALISTPAGGAIVTFDPAGNVTFAAP